MNKNHHLGGHFGDHIGLCDLQSNIWHQNQLPWPWKHIIRHQKHKSMMSSKIFMRKWWFCKIIAQCTSIILKAILGFKDTFWHANLFVITSLNSFASKTYFQTLYLWFCDEEYIDKVNIYKNRHFGSHLGGHIGFYDLES